MKKYRKKKLSGVRVYRRVSMDNQVEKDPSSLESQKEHVLNFIKKPRI